MQLDADELLEGLDALARREKLVARLDRDSMVAALGQARTLAAGRPEHEPAALLYAFGRRTAHFGPVAHVFLRSLALTSGGVGASPALRHLTASPAGRSPSCPAPQ
jgi:hypothetical protein